MCALTNPKLHRNHLNTEKLCIIHPKKKRNVLDKVFLESVECFAKRNRCRSLRKKENLDIIFVKVKGC